MVADKETKVSIITSAEAAHVGGTQDMDELTTIFNKLKIENEKSTNDKLKFVGFND